jgi:hypothetical protein
METKPLYRLPASSDRNTAAGIFIGSALTVVACLVLVFWAVTQWTAWKLSYQAGLGAPLFSASASERLWLGALIAVAVGTAIAGLGFARMRPWCPGCLLLATLAAAAWAGPVYAPWDFFRWELQFGGVPGTEPT